MRQRAAATRGRCAEPSKPRCGLVGGINERVFLVNACLGLYPELLEDRQACKARFGRSRWVAFVAACATFQRARHRPESSYFPELSSRKYRFFRSSTGCIFQPVITSELSRHEAFLALCVPRSCPDQAQPALAEGGSQAVGATASAGARAHPDPGRAPYTHTGPPASRTGRLSSKPSLSPQTESSQRSPILRSYPRNSPEAAARIVALVLISDGHVCSSEFDILRQLGAERQLGLEPQLLPHIVHTLCEELLAGGYETGPLISNVDDSTMASLMAEISDPALQRKVLRLSLAAARADGHLADGEALVVEAARHHWKLVDGEEPIATKVAHHHAA